MTSEMLLDLLAVRINGPAWDGVARRFDLTITDRGEQWAVGLANAALHASPGRHHGAAAADAGLALDHAVLAALVTGAQTLDDVLEAGTAVLSGDRGALDALFVLLDDFDMGFPIVTP
jgi:alkyl sulfatase BDS1-like metallo-beta-lactamase superfamily hydrolase